MIEALLQAERLLVHGMVDQAEQIYQNAITQDPRNAIAVVGLARVALERGQERLAYERARDALAIDPQNVAAQRLEQRLAEVFAEREHPAAPPHQSELPRPSEQAVFNRNPSMADHAAAEDRRSAAAQPQPEPDDTAPPERKAGLFRRILDS